MYTVYLRTNLINGKQYVGLTSMTIEERAGNNGSRYENCPYLYAAIKKYGWNNFESIVLAKDLTHEKACELEQYYIQLYDTLAPNGYNLTLGGDSGQLHTEETKRRISQKTKGNKSRTGYKNSSEHNAKMSLRMKGNDFGKYKGKAVLQFTLNNAFIAEYPSSAEASRQTGIGSIKQAVRGKIKTAGGYIWKRKGK